MLSEPPTRCVSRRSAARREDFPEPTCVGRPGYVCYAVRDAGAYSVRPSISSLVESTLPAMVKEIYGTYNQKQPLSLIQST